MIKFILSKELITSFFTIVIAILIYFIVKQIILKMFKNLVVIAQKICYTLSVI